MRWTSNGTTPTATSGNLINGTSGTATFTGDDQNITLRAITAKSGYDTTAVKVSGTFHFEPHSGGGGGGG
jgi:hypothetical protein